MDLICTGSKCYSSRYCEFIFVHEITIGITKPNLHILGNIIYHTANSAIYLLMFDLLHEIQSEFNSMICISQCDKNILNMQLVVYRIY